MTRRKIDKPAAAPAAAPDDFPCHWCGEAEAAHGPGGKCRGRYLRFPFTPCQTSYKPAPVILFG